VRALLARGDHRTAFERILERYQHKVFRLAYSMLHDETQAQDAAQDTFLRLWKALPSYRGDASLSTWLYTIGRNTTLTHLAKRARHPTLSLDEPDVGEALERTAHQPPPVFGQDHDIGVALARLPDHYRRVITLFYLEQKSYEETAALLGVPLGTVKTYLHRAKKQLAAAVQHQLSTPSLA
jgi:RNA polymerase sigma-70 factor (ECF subfamily)